MKVITALLFTLMSMISYAKEISIIDVNMDIPDEWTAIETKSGVSINMSDTGIKFFIDIITAPRELTKDEIHGNEEPNDFESWGDFYGSGGEAYDIQKNEYTHTWLLYSKNYILMASLRDDSPISKQVVGVASKYLGTLAW